MLSLPIRYSD